MASSTVGGSEGCIVLWLDAGNVINKPLETLFELTRESGFVTVASKGTLQEWTHSQTLERLSSPEVYDLPMLNGAVLSFEIGNGKVQELIKRYGPKNCFRVKSSQVTQRMPSFCGVAMRTSALSVRVCRWVACAEDKECIAPAGSSRANHRQVKSEEGFIAVAHFGR